MPLNLDDFISRHLHGTQAKYVKKLKYTVEELLELASMSKETLQKEGSLVRVNPPCVIVGDINGQFKDLLRIFSVFTDMKNHTSGALATKYVFLGNYVEHGKQSFECLSLLLALKIRYSTKYQMLRGNHEGNDIKVGGTALLEELTERFGAGDAEKLCVAFNEVFSWMPLAGVVGEKILCVHGGISPHLQSLKDIEQIARPLMDVTKNPLAMDLLWSDPNEKVTGFPHNENRGISCYFGESEVAQVCKNLNVKLIVRGHQMMTSGFGSFADRKLITLFSAPRYQPELVNYDVGELLELAKMSKETFQKEGSLVRMNPPCVIVGDINGQFMDLLRMFSMFAVTDDKNNYTHGALNSRYVFMGNYIDRAMHSLECLSLVLALKNRFPMHYHLLRGNHEGNDIKVGDTGLLEQLIERFGAVNAVKLCDAFNEVFSWMPLAGVVGGKILCVHGGISPHLQSLKDIEQIPRPLMDVSKNPLAMDLLWAEPRQKVNGFPHNEGRGFSCYFGETEVAQVCKNLNVKLIVRGDEYMETGFGFFANRKLITLFTATCYQPGLTNVGAVLNVNAKGQIGFSVLEPSLAGTGN